MSRLLFLVFLVLAIAFISCYNPSNTSDPEVSSLDKLKLLHYFNLQKVYKNLHFKYADNFAELTPNYSDKEKGQNFCPKCKYYILYADSTSFLMQSVNFMDYDKDGKPRIITINEKGKLKVLQKD